MAQTITVIHTSRDAFVADVAYTVNGDVGGVVPHAIVAGGLGSKTGVPAHVWLSSPSAPVSAAIQRVRDARITLVDATNVTIDVAASTGSAAPVVRVNVARDADAMSVFAQLVKASIGGMGGGGGNGE